MGRWRLANNFYDFRFLLSKLGYFGVKIVTFFNTLVVTSYFYVSFLKAQIVVQCHEISIKEGHTCFISVHKCLKIESYLFADNVDMTSV